MSIAARIWLGLALVIAVVLTVHVWLQFEQERSLLLEATLRDRRFFGAALQSILAHDPADDPWRAARSLLRERSIQRGHIAVALRHEHAIRATARRMPPSELAR